jgi:hypothetical protein
VISPLFLSLLLSHHNDLQLIIGPTNKSTKPTNERSGEWAYDEDRRIRSTAYLISTGKESQQAGLFEIKGRIRAHILDHLFADGDELSLQNIIVNSLRKV